MFRDPTRTSSLCALFVVVSAVGVCGAAQVSDTPTEAQPVDAAVTPPVDPSLQAPATAGSQGEVTANDVYVRSGDSTNHYTICKLSAGNRVTIVSERGEWYEIAPPPGTFSLISGDYVDSADGKAGIINGDNVRVRAGSLLNDNKYTVQGMLTKGDTVTIIGTNPDGFLRIEPPPQATLWISKQFVQPLGAGGSRRTLRHRPERRRKRRHAGPSARRSQPRQPHPSRQPE